MKAGHLINIAAFSLSTFRLVHCHHIHARQQKSITRTFTGAPYPTGPGFDVPALTDITSGSAPEPTVALPKTFPVGSVPSVLGAGAVGIPDLETFDVSIYPPLDKVPPTNSPQVKEWLKEIEGVTIPNLKPTKDGSCESDPEFALEAGADGRCWWTCGGCVRETDIDGCQNRERWGLT
ncbi:chitin deacetylase, partial [Serendipita sp. 397]